MLDKVFVQGRLTRDPELKKTSGDVSVCNFTIAVNKKYGKEENTYFFDVVAWRHTAEFVARNFTKGRQILIDGELTSRNWEDKEKKKRTSIEIVANEIHFCDFSDSNNSTKNTYSNDYVSEEEEELF